MKRALPPILLCLAACHTAGSSWMAQPLPGDDDDHTGLEDLEEPPGAGGASTSRPYEGRPASGRIAGPPRRTVVIGESGARRRARGPVDPARLPGKVLGKFRNTYYDFPSELDHEGEPVKLKSAKCKTIREVPRGFYEAVCVQGSGTLSTGATVSFAKRDCDCAEVCPRTGQQICFDALDRGQFPWGRGATGRAITPLLTVAVDSDVIPLGTPIYIPEYDGLPRDAEGRAIHDGCFLAEDRGVRIKGKHVDLFMGHESMTQLWNQLVPSNQGVTIVLDNPRCARAERPE